MALCTCPVYSHIHTAIWLYVHVLYIMNTSDIGAVYIGLYIASRGPHTATYMSYEL